MVDPRNASISESNDNIWSLFICARLGLHGHASDVPHGAVDAVTYYSNALNRFRRMHVYTPPGYESSGSQKYPIFYLLHGAGDSDDAWTSVGRAGFIMDNLIADGESDADGGGDARRPHQPLVGARTGRARSTPPRDEFQEDFLSDIMPYAEKPLPRLDRPSAPRHRRAFHGRRPDIERRVRRTLDKFAYIGGVQFRSRRGGRPAARLGERHAGRLDNAAQEGLKLIWLSTGSDDGLITNRKRLWKCSRSTALTPASMSAPARTPGSTGATI